MPSVSIAMATYNGAKYIRRQLDSLAAQTHRPAELVVTDDGSSDDTLNVVTEFAKYAPFPVHIHRNEQRLGFRANFMKAAGLCCSDLIAFCDQDDEWYPHKLERCSSLFSQPAVMLVHHDADVVRHGRKIDSLRHFAPPRKFNPPLSLTPFALSPGFTQVFRRTLLIHSYLWPQSIDHRSPEEHLAHDQWFYFLASALGVIAYIDEPLVAYRQHGTNLYGHDEKEPPVSWCHLLTSPRERLGHPVPYFKNRATVLRLVKNDLYRHEREWVELGAAYYSMLAQFHKSRCQIYSSPHILGRAMNFLKLLQWGGYKTNWFGRKSMLRDALIGLPIGHILKG